MIGGYRNNSYRNNIGDYGCAMPRREAAARGLLARRVRLASPRVTRSGRMELDHEDGHDGT